MSRLTNIHQPVFVSLTLACIAAAWWGCTASPVENTTGTNATSSTSHAAAAGSGTGGAGGGISVGVGGGSTVDDGGSCTSTSVIAHRTPLDIIFLIDESGSNAGAPWQVITNALTTFFNNPAWTNIGVGLNYFPNLNKDKCIPADYETLDVPIDVLPKNAFALTNSIPADAVLWGTPTYGALKGTLAAATAYQDAHPTHKVVVVLATDGDPNSCGAIGIPQIAALAKSAHNYNGVRTYVIAIPGAVITTMDQIATAGGTTAAYDITSDINQLSTTLADITKSTIGACEFEIPPPPNNEQLDPEKVNFSYTPKGMGMPKVLLRADDLPDCNGKPGWYYDNNLAPTKIILCPASCSTVEADPYAKVDVLFGCKSWIN